MELRQWAHYILSADTLEQKLFTPPCFTDQHPGPMKIWNEPCRPANLKFSKRAKEEKLPPFHDHHHPDKRAICLHRFAGHELLAVEIMAYALLRFPEASSSFRIGVANILKEEQEHVRLYLKQMHVLGIKFGDLPVYRHFWCHTPYLTSPLSYVSVMSLTFEMANLDFAPMYGHSFERNGDLGSAILMKRILNDEIQHVSFGWHYLAKFKKKTSSHWQAWKEALSPLLIPKRARGFILHEEPRKQAGISKAWIKKLKSL